MPFVARRIFECVCFSSIRVCFIVYKSFISGEKQNAATPILNAETKPAVSARRPFETVYLRYSLSINDGEFKYSIPKDRLIIRNSINAILSTGLFEF